MGRIRWGNNLDRPCQKEHLPGRIIDQVIGVDAAQARGQVPTRSGPERQLIRRGSDCGGDDCHALCASSTSTADGAAGDSGVTAAFLDESYGAYDVGRGVDGGGTGGR